MFLRPLVIQNFLKEPTKETININLKIHCVCSQISTTLSKCERRNRWVHYRIHIEIIMLYSMLKNTKNYRVEVWVCGKLPSLD